MDSSATCLESKPKTPPPAQVHRWRGPRLGPCGPITPPGARALCGGRTAHPQTKAAAALSESARRLPRTSVPGFRILGPIALRCTAQATSLMASLPSGCSFAAAGLFALLFIVLTCRRLHQCSVLWHALCLRVRVSGRQRNASFTPWV